MSRRFALLSAIGEHAEGAEKATFSVQPYSESFKKKMVQRLLLPNGPTATALSKEVGERTAAMFHRRAGMSVAALRYTYIGRPDEAAESAARIQRDPAAGIRTLWSYVDIRDAATATRLALEADGLTFEVFNVAAADTLSDIPTEKLLREYAPSVEVRKPLPGHASAYSIEKARRVIGYEPAHSWRHEPAHA